MQERYRALLLAARNLLSLTSLDDLVENILKYSCVMMQAEVCSMFVPDRATRELILHSALGKDDAIHHFRIPWDKGIAGTVFQQRKFMRIDDALNDPRLLRVTNAKTGLVTRSMICAPLVDKDDCFGVLQALNPIGRPVFTRLDQDIFEGLTNIVTGALIRFDRELKIDREAKLAQEMALAMEIQKSYLPPEELCLPRSEMRVRYRAARTIGGDFYASIALPGDRLLAALGDVSGKGIPAALTTAQITTEMHALAHLAKKGLEAYVTALNEELCKRLAAGRFAATTFLLYDPHGETMEVICAGQFEPWRWRNDAWEPVAVPHALVVGRISSTAGISMTTPASRSSCSSRRRRWKSPRRRPTASGPGNSSKPGLSPPATPTWSGAASCWPPMKRSPTSSGTPIKACRTSPSFSRRTSPRVICTCACAITALPWMPGP